MVISRINLSVVLRLLHNSGIQRSGEEGEYVKVARTRPTSCHPLLLKAETKLLSYMIIVLGGGPLTNDAERNSRQRWPKMKESESFPNRKCLSLYLASQLHQGLSISVSSIVITSADACMPTHDDCHILHIKSPFDANRFGRKQATHSHYVQTRKQEKQKHIKETAITTHKLAGWSGRSDQNPIKSVMSEAD